MAKKKSIKSELTTKKCMLCETRVQRVETGYDIICWECTQLSSQGYDRESIKLISRKERDTLFVK